MTILITGATGNIGRPLTRLLHEAGADIRVITRNPAARLPIGVQTARSVRDGFHDGRGGVTAVFLNSRALGSDLDWTIDAAKASGAKLVALSALNVDEDLERQPSRLRGDRNKEVEQRAIDSGLPWVSLRPGMFASNLLGMWAGQLRVGDVVAGPHAAASTAPIAEDDVAAVAARALLGDDLLGRVIPLTGPQLLTNTELLATAGRVLGRDLTYREIPAEEVRKRFTAIGFPAEFGTAYTALLAEMVDNPPPVTDNVERILGRPARTFAEWVNDHRGAFARTSENNHA